MAKLTLAMTLTDPNDLKKVLGYSVDLSLSWIDENNDKVSRSWIVFAYGRRIDQTHACKISSYPNYGINIRVKPRGVPS